MAIKDLILKKALPQPKCSKDVAGSRQDEEAMGMGIIHISVVNLGDD
jgi:hypothetical protein